MTEQEFEELRKKVNNLEYVELKEIKDNLIGLKIDLNTNNLLTQQAIDSNKKLSETMETFKTTMVEMSQSLRDGNKISSELAETVSKLNTKVDTIQNNVDEKFETLNGKIVEVDEKSKIDIVKIQKEKTKADIGKVLACGGIVGIIVSAIVEIVKRFV